MPLLNQLVGGRLGQVLGQNNQSGGQKQVRSKFERTLRFDDFATGTTSSLPAGKYSQIGTFVISAQLEATLGVGDSTLNPMEQGRPYIDMVDDASNAENGFIKLTHENATGNKKDTVVERRSEQFRESTRSERIVMPRATAKQGVGRLKQDDQIGFYFKPDSSDKVDTAASTMELPVTFYEVGV